MSVWVAASRSEGNKAAGAAADLVSGKCRESAKVAAGFFFPMIAWSQIRFLMSKEAFTCNAELFTTELLLTSDYSVPVSTFRQY